MPLYTRSTTVTFRPCGSPPGMQPGGSAMAETILADTTAGPGVRCGGPERNEGHDEF